MSNQQIPRGKRMPTSLLFLINGISSLLAWNAVLSSLDYFAYVYADYSVYTLFTPPLFVGYFIICLLYQKLSLKFSYRVLIIFGITVANVALVLLLLLALTCKESQAFGFYMSLICNFTLGVGANCSQLSFFSMINYLSQSVVSRFTIGTALSGLSLNILRLIIVAIAGTDNQNTAPIIIYFIIAIFFNFLTMVLNFSFFKSRQYKKSILPFVNLQKKELNQEVQQQGGDKISPTLQKSATEENGYFKLLWLTSKEIFPYPHLIFANYVVTFMLFPGLSVDKQFQGMSFTWSSLIIILFYQIGDTAGKFICDYRKTFNALSVVYVFCSRAYFFVTIPLMAISVLDDDVLINNYFFPLFNQFLFALTNGMLTNAAFIYSFETCPVKYKKYAGVLGGICLQFGIMVGTFVDIPFTYLVTGK